MAISLQRGECRLRDILGDMKPAEFARRMGVHRSTVYRWMNNQREMPYEETVLGGRILDRHSEEFFVWIEVPRKLDKRHKE